jgi:hypothetical protein
MARRHSNSLSENLAFQLLHRHSFIASLNSDLSSISGPTLRFMAWLTQFFGTQRIETANAVEGITGPPSNETHVAYPLKRSNFVGF